jgi:hypothetical protein
MTMGSGCSDCYRVGMTYGYRECLRKGRVRQKLRREFAGSQDSANLRRASLAKQVPGAFCSIVAMLLLLHLRKKHFAVFPCDRISRKMPRYDRDCSPLNVGFFSSFSPGLFVKKIPAAAEMAGSRYL